MMMLRWTAPNRATKALVTVSLRASLSSIPSPASNPPKSPSPSLLSQYLELSKARLSSLVVLTTAAGYISVGAPIDPCTMISTCLGTGLCAASASSFNQVLETQNDSWMKRTSQRPLVKGTISPSAAVAWAGATGVLGTSLLYVATNPTVALLGVGNIVLYAGLYTYSKRVSEWNTWLGSIVGAVPPLMGWAASAGGESLLTTYDPWILASLLALWQFPHFFALSWLHREDYARGRFAMVAVNDPTGQRSANLILEYSLYLAAVPLITSYLGVTSYMFAVEGSAANAYLLFLANKFHGNRTNANAKRIFLCSLWYLPVVLTGFVLHTNAWYQEKTVEEVVPADQVQLSDTVLQTRANLKGMCVHEIIAHHETASNPQLCLKVKSDQVARATKDAAETLVTSSPQPAPQTLTITREP